MNIADTKRLIRALPHEIPVFLWGFPGIGKSQAVQQLAKEDAEKSGKPVGFKDVRLTTLDPTDLRGLPVVDRESNLVRWFPPALLPSVRKDAKGKLTKDSDPETGYLMLDELNSAHPTIQAAAYQLVLDRKIGEYILPEGWRIIAAGNREGDGGVTFVMPRPLQNRFSHINVDVDVECWLEWARKEHISHVVRAFIMNNNKLLCDEKPTQGSAFATPRTWEYTSKIIKRDIDEDLLIPAIANTIGEAVGAQFITFVKLRNKIPNVINILTKGERPEIPKKSDLQYAFYAAFCGQLESLLAKTKGGAVTLGKNAKFKEGLLYIMEQVDREFAELIVKFLAHDHGALFLGIVGNSKEFTKKFGNIYKEMMACVSKFKKKQNTK